MAFITGTVNSFDDLRTALLDGCTANGWTLAGNVLSKGTCFVAVAAAAADRLGVQGGTGIDDTNILTGAGPRAPMMYASQSGMAITWPATYRLHVLDDEVYLVLNYGVGFYQWLAFGSSPVVGLPGTGNWYGGTFDSVHIGGLPYIGPQNGGGYTNAGTITSCSAALFWQTSGWSPGYCVNSYVHHALTDTNDGWSGVDAIDVGAKSAASAIVTVNPLMSSQPNAFNGETCLLPIQPIIYVASSKTVMVATLQHSRYARIDNYAPQDILTLGEDRWCMYPWMAKNASARDGGRAVAHTGTLGWAIRYDGP